jgi:hypothetical protein
MNGRQVLEIRRSDQTRLSGDGSQGQHQVHIEGEGTGNSTILIDAITGVTTTLESQQELHIAVRTSGRIQNFVQTTKQMIQQTR